MGMTAGGDSGAGWWPVVGSNMRVVRLDGATEEYGGWATCGSCGTVLGRGGCGHGQAQGESESYGVDQVVGAEGQERGGADAGGSRLQARMSVEFSLETVEREVLEMLFGGPVVPLCLLPIPSKGQE